VKNERYEVIVQKWEESERSWGTRPDGFSLHLTEADRQAYIREYWSGMPDRIPNKYSRPDGTPYKANVDAATFAEVKTSKNGIREHGRPPGSGGTDGWISPS
jgi:hypothetical protein